MEKIDEFLEELTLLAQRFGLGIGGDATIFMMNPEDQWLRYECSHKGDLIFREI